MSDSIPAWEGERRELLERRISELGLSIQGTPVERLVAQLHDEMAARDLSFRPPVYLSDEWGCPESTPLIAIPFYLADPRLARIEEEMAFSVEDEREIMRILRHEAGHAINYAYRLYERAEWHQRFGPYSRPYRDRFRANPLSREHVRHLPGWYAQKHPDEDFAETFAVWLTPGCDWRGEYAEWPALAKLEYVDRLMAEIGPTPPSHAVVAPLEDDLPVDVMNHTIAEHYERARDPLPVGSEHHFDGDLRTLFAERGEAPEGEPANEFIRRHRREIVQRIAFWTGEHVPVVREFAELLERRAGELELTVRGLEASTLIELTAFGTAVITNHRYTSTGPQGDGPEDSET